MALMGLVPVVATASFPLINLPNFYLSFTILVSFILVKYPDRIGLVNTVPWYVGTYRRYDSLSNWLCRGVMPLK